MIRQPETTDLKYSQRVDWLKFRQDRSVSSGQLYLAIDGSTTGWHAAVLINPGNSVHYVANKAEFHKTRNISGELHGYLLGLQLVPARSSVIIIHDFVGISGWTTGNWKLNSDIVIEKIAEAHKLIREKELDVLHCHHYGHQDKKRKERPICHSDFTKWNVFVDKLCEDKKEIDIKESK